MKRFTGIGGRHAIDDLSYYYGNTNQLQYVSDASASEAGFNDGNRAGNDFHYDANGNLDLDKNKHITAIRYNVLNLPEEIIFSKENKQATIRYRYDAAGYKLAKVVTDYEQKRTTTYYIAGIEYVQEESEESTLSLIHHAEGRIKPQAAGGYVYHYDVKDHLGNVRVTFASETTTDAYLATMEIDEPIAEDESKLFANYMQARLIANDTYDHTNTGSPEYSLRLSAAQGEVIGLRACMYREATRCIWKCMPLT